MNWEQIWLTASGMAWWWGLIGILMGVCGWLQAKRQQQPWQIIACLVLDGLILLLVAEVSGIHAAEVKAALGGGIIGEKLTQITYLLLWKQRLFDDENDK